MSHLCCPFESTFLSFHLRVDLKKPLSSVLLDRDFCEDFSCFSDLSPCRSCASLDSEFRCSDDFGKLGEVAKW